MGTDLAARVIIPHADLGEDTYHAWVFIDAGRFKANRNGVPNPRMSYADWRRAVCNNPDCPAWGVVNEAVLVSALEAAEVQS